PPYAPLLGAVHAVAHRYVHRLRVCRMNREPVDCPGGQTAHRAPPSEAVGVAVQPVARPSIEEDPAHACWDVDGRKDFRLPGRAVVHTHPLLAAICRPIDARTHVTHEGVELRRDVGIDGEAVNVEATETRVHGDPLLA